MKNRSNALAAILGNLEDLEGAYDRALKAEGSAQKELDTYLNSIQGRIDKFTNAVQTMWMNLISSDLIKWFVDAGTKLIKIFDEINQIPKVGPWISLSLIVGAFFGLLKGVPALLGKVIESTSLSSIAKKESSKQTSILSNAIKEESASRTTNIAATNAETAAIKANTAAQIENNKAHSGEIFDVDLPDVDVPDVDVPDVLEGQIGFDDLTNSGKAAKEITEEVAEEAVEAAVEMGAAGTAAAGATKAAGTGLAGLGAKIGAFFTSTLGYITIAAAAIAAIALIADASTTSFKEAKENLKESTEELEQTRSQIEALNNELDVTNDRISELEKKGALTFTEEEELANLKAQNAELERSIALEKEREKYAMRQQAEDAKEVFEKDTRLQSHSYQIPNVSNAEQARAYYSQPHPYGSYGSSNTVQVDPYAESLIETYTNNEIALAKARKKYYDQLESYNNGDNKDKKALEKAKAEFEEAQAAFESTRDSIDEYMIELNDTYGALEWQYGDNLEEWQIELNAMLKTIYDSEDQLAIAIDKTGKATENAFKRVSTQTEFQDITKQIQDGNEDILRQLQSAILVYDNFHELTSGGIGEIQDEGLRSFIQSLIDAGFIADTSAESIQKVIDACGGLNEETSEASIENMKLARSQKRLQYYRLYKELNKYAKKLKEAKQNTKALDEADKKRIATIKQQMELLAQQISQYDVLGKQIAKAKAAFDTFEEAQNADAESDRLETAGEMFKAIIDGFHSAELGSETFKAAMAGLVPEEVYKDLDTLKEKYYAVWDYMNQDLSRYFTLEYDDEGLVSDVKTTTADVQRFMEDAQTKGLISFADGIWTVNEDKFSDFAEKMNITESALYALAVQADKIDADWIMGDSTTFLSSFDMGAETNLYNIIKGMAELDQALIDGKYEDNIKGYVDAYKEYQDSYDTNASAAVDDIIAYQDATETVAEYYSTIQKERQKLEQMQADGASDDLINAQVSKIDGLIAGLSEALKIKDSLGEPTELVINIAYDHMESEIENMQAQWQSKYESNEIEIPLVVNGVINDRLIKQDLETGEYTVAITPQFEGLSAESKGFLYGFVDSLNKQEALKLMIEGDEESKEKLISLQEELAKVEAAIENLPDPQIDVNAAITNIKRLKNEIAAITGKTVEITVIPNIGGLSNEYKGAFGTGDIDEFTRRGMAFAEGSSSVSHLEKNALVGELGRETVVDPHTGTYYTVGDHGAELVNLPKDAIIFNHRQTEELFKNGHINSRGKAYVSGNAYAGTSGTIFDDFANPNAFGGGGGHSGGSSSDSEEPAEEFEEILDWFEILIQEMENQTSLMEAQLENSVGIDSKKGIYSGLIAGEKTKLDALNDGIKLYTDQANKFLAQIPAQYKELAKDGGVKITEFVGDENEAVVEAINNYREWAQKASDLNVQLEETKALISDLRVETQDMISTEYENKIGLITHLNDTLEAEMGLLEERGERSSGKFYDEMIKNGESQLKLLQQKRDAMQSELDSAVKSGDVAKYSDDWYQMVNAIYDVDEAVIDCKTSIEGFNNSIQELHWENFEKIIDGITAVSDEAEQLRDLIDDTDITETSDPEKWSKDGVTALGLVAQQMENAQYRAKLYGDEIDYLNAEFAKGNYSQDEYNEKLKELKDNQWDAIDAYESAKKAITDLNKTRVEAIKTGIEAEIDAYSELIEKRKQDLDAQKD